ncbi:MAG: AMP-binding protein [Vicinamibacterales bacterium]
MKTLIDVFRLLESRRGEFLVYDDGYRVRRYSYTDVTGAARGLAAQLAAAGITPGDKVLIWGENRPEWLVAYWGAVISGVIVVPIDFRSSPEFVARVRDIVGARLIFSGDDVSAFASASAAGTGSSFGGIKPLSSVDWAAGGPMPPVTVDRDDVAQIVFTSGATAEPKGVVIRHRNILANLVPVADEIAKYKKYARPFSPIRFLNLLPLSHMFGQAMATNIPPLIDGTVVFMRSFNPHDITRRVKEWRISVIVCVPKILEVLKDHAIRVDPSAAEPPGGLSIPKRWWRYRRIHRAFGLKFWAFIVGAAPLGPALEDFWKRLGFVVIQGYGLTETAPIVTLNHPFKTNTGSVGTAIAGVEIKIADDGEILVRGENVSTGYYEQPGVESLPGAIKRPSGSESSSGLAHRSLGDGGRMIDAEHWLHTGDIGEKDANGRLFIRGRKKEMIVTPEGLNVFPDDVERVLNEVDGVVESAVVAATAGATERVHAVLVLSPGVESEAVVRAANAKLADHQRIRSASVWTDGALPRTEGTRKLKRAAIKAWVATGARPATTTADGDPLQALVAKFAGARALGGDTSLEGLGLSSLERVELMVALEDQFQTRIDETKFTGARTLDDLRAVIAAAPQEASVTEPVDFPSWNRTWPVRWIRRVSQFTWILPLARMFAWTSVSGLDHLRDLKGPVVFAANHQSHFDVPVILAALPGSIRARIAPAMAKEFFKAHFFPEQFSAFQVLTNRLNYYLAAFFFNTFPLPQREAGARQTLRYIGEVIGEGYSVLIFPEGVRSETGEIQAFRGGIGMIGSRLDLPVVPVRLGGVNKVLHARWKMAKPGPVTVAFGKPIHLSGDDYAALALQVEQAVRDLPSSAGT